MKEERARLAEPPSRLPIGLPQWLPSSLLPSAALAHPGTHCRLADAAAGAPWCLGLGLTGPLPARIPAEVEELVLEAVDHSVAAGCAHGWARSLWWVAHLRISASTCFARAHVVGHQLVRRSISAWT